MPCAAASATTSSTGWSGADLVVGPHHRDQRHRARVALDRGGAARRRRAGPRRRRAAARPRRPRCRAASASGSSTAWCSTAVVRMRVRRWSSASRAQWMPLSARLSASVPPEVNTTSPGRQFSACAMVSRDSSTTRRALRPGRVQRARVADLAQVRGHRVDRRGHHRRGRGVVEVVSGTRHRVLKRRPSPFAQRRRERRFEPIWQGGGAKSCLSAHRATPAPPDRERNGAEQAMGEGRGSMTRGDPADHDDPGRT